VKVADPKIVEVASDLDDLLLDGRGVAGSKSADF
jgi:hypothetical protein